MIPGYQFNRKKYGDELLVDLIQLEDLNPYLAKHPIHKLAYFDITLITSGEGSFWIDCRQTKLEKGTVLFSKPGQVRCWNFKEIPHGLVLIFESEFLSSFFNDPLFLQKLSYFDDFSHHPYMHLSHAELESVMSLMEQMKSEVRTKELKDHHLLRALLYQVLMYLNRMYLARQSEGVGQIQNRYVKKFINLANDQGWHNRSVSFYAQSLNITSGYLNELTGRCLGVTAKRYLIGRTLLEAKRLLSYTHMSVDEVALHLNYETTSYFIRFFKAETEVTPLTFRRQMQLS